MGTADTLKTTFKNTSGQRRFFPFVGPHGVWLDDGGTTTQPGGPYRFIRPSDSRSRDFLDKALADQVLAIVASPQPVYADAATATPQVLQVAAGAVQAVDPPWGVAPADAAVTVTSTTPANGAKSVAAGATIVADFSVAVTGVTFAVKTGTTTVSGSAAGSNGNKTWTFTPSAALTGGAVYNVTVSGGVTAASVPMEAVTFAFSVAPQVSSVTPANNATSVATGTTVAVVFNEAVTGATVALKQGSTAVDGTTAISNGSKTYTLTPASALAAGKAYTVTVSGGKDAAGNVMATFTSTFNT